MPSVRSRIAAAILRASSSDEACQRLKSDVNTPSKCCVYRSTAPFMAGTSSASRKVEESIGSADS